METKMKTLLMLPILGSLLLAAIQATGKDQAPTDTTAGWVKCAKNLVLDGALGTCFDISVLKEGDTYRM
jgi:beta-1,2-mannobiose phosphorylase / 1,2-beta-oligomannan phosphorylase